jgi:hypothetical protein
MLALLQSSAAPVCWIALIFSRIMRWYSVGEQFPEAISHVRRAIVSPEFSAVSKKASGSRFSDHFAFINTTLPFAAWVQPGRCAQHASL